MKYFHFQKDDRHNTNNLVHYLHSTYTGTAFHHCDIRVHLDLDFVMMWVNELEEDEFTDTLVVKNNTILQDPTFLDLIQKCKGVVEDEDDMV